MTRLHSAPAASPSAAAPAFHYVAIGASDTVGVGASDPAIGSWPARLTARLPVGTHFVNLGVSGSVAAQAAAEQAPVAVGLGPQLVTIWLGVNDLNAGVHEAEYAAALGSIIQPLVSRTDARILIGLLPDLRTVPAYAGTDLAALFARVTAYNAAIVALAARFPGRVTVVDLFTGSGPLVNTMTVSGDGFHPSDAGYALIAERFAAAMRSAGIAIR